jgi:hypothetical protein
VSAGQGRAPRALRQPWSARAAGACCGGVSRHPASQPPVPLLLIRAERPPGPSARAASPAPPTHPESRAGLRMVIPDAVCNEAAGRLPTLHHPSSCRKSIGAWPLPFWWPGMAVWPSQMLFTRAGLLTPNRYERLTSSSLLVAWLPTTVTRCWVSGCRSKRA